MTDEEQKKSFEDLEARLNKARQASPSAKLKEAELKVDNTGVGQAFRIGVDMLAALMVGTFIGWYLDRWLGTKPLFLITFMVLGGGQASATSIAPQCSWRKTSKMRQRTPLKWPKLRLQHLIPTIKILKNKKKIIFFRQRACP